MCECEKLRRFLCSYCCLKFMTESAVTLRIFLTTKPTHAIFKNKPRPRFDVTIIFHFDKQIDKFIKDIITITFRFLDTLKTDFDW